MDKQNVLCELGAFGLNLYDAAILDDEGLETRRYQPCGLCHNSYSVAKAFTMTAVGLLQEEGMLSTGDSVARFFPQWAETEPGWARVTLHDVLRHRIGFADGFVNTDEDTEAFLARHAGGDYLALVCGQRLAYAPGTHYDYSDTAYYLLSRVIAAAAGKKLDEVLRERLICPLGFSSVAWSRCPAGYPMGATGLYISAGDMVKLGFLYLRNGVYQGRRVLSSAWVRQALDNEYEFKALPGTDLIGKGGMHGQMLLFSPRGDFAAAWHGHFPSEECRKLISLFVKQQKNSPQH